jgi:FMN-dependent NADH-azoreductase
MRTLLHIDSSPMGEDSVSRRLTREFVHQWRAANRQRHVISRDLAAIAIPVIDAEWVAANYTRQEARTTRQNDLLSLSSAFIADLIDADEYVIGIPVHNWGPSASFKLWVDQIVTPFGPTLRNKRATFIIAAGRLSRSGSTHGSKNHIEPWLRTLFGRLGVEDMRFLLADNAADLRTGETDLAVFLAPHIQTIHSFFAEDPAFQIRSA